MAAFGQEMPPARVHAAGSLRIVLTEAAAAFRSRTGSEVHFEFAPSGLLRERLASGEGSDVFASANLEHPRALQEAGKAGEVRRFTTNRLCALAPSRLGVTTFNLLDRLLNPAVKVGMSTPGADPAGDYVLQVFRHAEKMRPGAFHALEKKALRLLGGPESTLPPAGRSIYGHLVDIGAADIFLTYCTNATVARREMPTLSLIDLPKPLAVHAEFGLVVMKGASATGEAFAAFLLAAEGQRILEAFGFGG